MRAEGTAAECRADETSVLLRLAQEQLAAQEAEVLVGY